MSELSDTTVEHGVNAGGRLEQSEPGAVRIRRALLSVSDKRGVVGLARGLGELGVEVVSTGGTARELREAGLPVRAIEDFTGFPEIMDGRVKTLHPRLYAGLLAVRSDPHHVRAAEELGIEPVDLVGVNLYPFEETVARDDAAAAEIIENIDIGGPTMIRAAAKNHAFAAVLVDPGDYDAVLAELRERSGILSIDTRRRLAGKAFAYTARYDSAIASWFARREGEDFPQAQTRSYERALALRYGENPHQRAAYYRETGSPSHLLEGVLQHQGKELSFNNLLDLNAARELVEELGPEPACVIVKHNNPCGAAVAETPLEAYRKAFACDPLSAFGGVIAVNRGVDAELARALGEQFLEVLFAPGYDRDARGLLSAKKNVRVLELTGDPGEQPALELKPVRGGVLIQDRDRAREQREDMRAMTTREPSEQQWQDLLFAWRVCRHVRSNAIVLASGGATIGIGAGQMSRVDAVRIAVAKAREFRPEQLAGAVLASDAFFPFPDGPELAIAAGVAAIIQPGGSVRDADVVAAAERAGVAMVATGVRHFRH